MLEKDFENGKEGNGVELDNLDCTTRLNSILSQETRFGHET